MKKKDINKLPAIKTEITTPTTELIPAVKTETAIANNIKQPLRGFEEPTDTKDLILPRAQLIQKTADILNEGIDGVKPGIVINSLTHDVLPLQFIPIFKYTEYIKFNPRNIDDPAFDKTVSPGALVWKFTDPHDPRVAECEFGNNGEKPSAQKVINFLAYFVGHSMPIVLSFAKTSFKGGKKLISLAQMLANQKTPDMFCQKYNLLIKLAESNGNKYFILDVGYAGLASAEEHSFAEQWYTSFRRQPIEADVKVMNDEQDNSDDLPPV